MSEYISLYIPCRLLKRDGGTGLLRRNVAVCMVHECSCEEYEKKVEELRSRTLPPGEPWDIDWP